MKDIVTIRINKGTMKPLEFKKDLYNKNNVFDVRHGYEYVISKLGDDCYWGAVCEYAVTLFGAKGTFSHVSEKLNQYHQDQREKRFQELIDDIKNNWEMEID